MSVIKHEKDKVTLCFSFAKEELILLNRLCGVSSHQLPGSPDAQLKLWCILDQMQDTLIEGLDELIDDFDEYQDAVKRVKDF